LTDSERERVHGEHTEPREIEIEPSAGGGTSAFFRVPPREEPVIELHANVNGRKVHYVSQAESAVRAAAPAGGGRSGSGEGAFSYSPDLPLISKVEVIPWKSDYSYYLSFCGDAVRLADYTADKCEYKPFFSYMPQYSQMDASQLAYYFYLREAVRSSEYPEADVSYLLLLIYEAINLAGVRGADDSLAMLCGIAEGYSEAFPRIAMRLSDWICDLCLIHKLTLPALPAKTLVALSSFTSLKEFYVGGSTADAALSILLSASGYDYHKSRFCTGENLPLFEKHIQGALSRVVSGAGEEKLLSTLTETRVTRDTFVGALCGPQSKKKLVISYRSLSRSHEFRFAVADMVKYCENRLRTALGLKSKLSVGKLGPGVKEAIDAYFDAAFPGKNHKAEPEYERLYDPPATEVTTDAARKIEEESWEITDKLISAFADAEEETENPGGSADEGGQNAEPEASGCCETDVAPAEQNNTDDVADNPAVGFTADETAFIRACLSRDRDGQRSAAAAAGASPDLMCDRINEKALDIIGDVVIETDGKTFAVSEFYIDEIRGIIENG